MSFIHSISAASAANSYGDQTRAAVPTHALANLLPTAARASAMPVGRPHRGGLENYQSKVATASSAVAVVAGDASKGAHVWGTTRASLERLR